MRLLSKYNLEKIFLLLITVVVINGCATTKSINIESNIGLYEIVDKDCRVAQSDFDPCKYTLFFELLKGQFIGVKDSELAFVFWGGDPKIDSELQYTSHLIRNHRSRNITDNKFWLSSDGESQEYLSFSGGKIVGYHVVYNASNTVKRRAIHYKLNLVQRGDFPLVRMNYPGNK